MTYSPDNYWIIETVSSFSKNFGVFKTNERDFIRYQDISSTITTLQIVPYSLWMVQRDCLDLRSFPMLESFVMDCNNGYFVLWFLCVNHKNIKSISIGNDCFQYALVNDQKTLVFDDSMASCVLINHNPLLETLKIGGGSFTSSSIVTIRGMYVWI